jgi:hypothetical protein
MQCKTEAMDGIFQESAGRSTVIPRDWPERWHHVLPCAVKRTLLNPKVCGKTDMQSMQSMKFIKDILLLVATQ